MEMVVFFCGSILQSVPICCHFLRKNNIQLTIAVANCYRRSDLLPVVFSVPKGPLGLETPVRGGLVPNFWVTFH